MRLLYNRHLKMLILRLFGDIQHDLHSVEFSGFHFMAFIQITTLLVAVQGNTCDLSSCTNCLLDNFEICAACIDEGYGFSSDNSSCIPCQTGCVECVMASECTDCANAAEGPLHDGSGACGPCSYQCFQCSEAGSCDANSCNNFYASNSTNGQCEACSVNCESCALNGPGKCDICSQQSGIDWSTYTPGQRPLPCKRCDDPNCVSCYGNYQDCDKCSFKYYQDDGYRCEAVNKSFQAYPLFGPISGGTVVTISLNQLSGVSIVYFDNYSMSSHSTKDPRYITALSPSVNTTGSLLITLANNDGDQLSTNLYFVTKPNPVISTILPRNHLTSGGTIVTISGNNFNSIAREPVINVTVMITRVGTNNQAATVSQSSMFANCHLEDTIGELMICSMPPLNLPSDFQDRLIKDTTNSGRKTSAIESNEVDYVMGLNGLDRADIYLGFSFDAYKFYLNIDNTTLSGVQLLFYPSPILASGTDVVTIITNSTQLLHITGKNMLRGCQMADYFVSIGDGECQIQTLTDNELMCLPPSTSPTQNKSSAQCCFCTTNASLDIVVSIGYKTYQYACAEYQPSTVAALTELDKSVSLITGLVAGLGGAIIIIIIVIGILIYRRRQTKQLLNGCTRATCDTDPATFHDYITHGLTLETNNRSKFGKLFSQPEKEYVAMSAMDKNDSGRIVQDVAPAEADISDYITHGVTRGTKNTTEFGKLFFSQPKEESKQHNKMSAALKTIDDNDSGINDATDA